MNTPVIVALGSNDKGDFSDVGTLLQAAVHDLESVGLKRQALSSWWWSSAWPDPADPPFLNAVLAGWWAGSVADLMAQLHAMEARHGRRRERRNAPRTLDLDLIDFGGEVRDGPGLILPHPRAAERLFVMGPLAEIRPDWRHPRTGVAATELARAARVGRDARPL